MKFQLAMIFTLFISQMAFLVPARGATFDEARHLLARTGFGASTEEIRSLMALEYSKAVARLLAQTRSAPQKDPPGWVQDAPLRPKKFKQLNGRQRRTLRRQRRNRVMELKGWWFKEMLVTGTPFTEHMTLFWHNHFTSSLKKVRYAALMYRQNLLLRQHALGNAFCRRKKSASPGIRQSDERRVHGRLWQRAQPQGHHQNPAARFCPTRPGRAG